MNNQTDKTQPPDNGPSPAAHCSAIFATSLRRMSEWYGYHQTPGAITPLDAIQAALCDVAIASEKAAEGLVWKSQNEWEPFGQNATGHVAEDKRPEPRWVTAAEMQDMPKGWYWAPFPNAWIHWNPDAQVFRWNSSGWFYGQKMSKHYWGPFVPPEREPEPENESVRKCLAGLPAHVKFVFGEDASPDVRQVIDYLEAYVRAELER